MLMNREQWMKAAGNKLVDAERLIASLLIAARRLDDEDINQACEQLDIAIEALKQAALALGVEEPF